MQGLDSFEQYDNAIDNIVPTRGYQMTPMVRERAPLALAEILGRPLAEEGTLLPHLFYQAQECLTQSEIIRIVMAVEAMRDWQESEVHVQENRA